MCGVVVAKLDACSAETDCINVGGYAEPRPRLAGETAVTVAQTTLLREGAALW